MGKIFNYQLSIINYPEGVANRSGVCTAGREGEGRGREVPSHLFLTLTLKKTMNKEKWKAVLQFVITVLTAIVGSLTAQSCFAF